MQKSLFLFPVILCLAIAAGAQTTTFTYQGSMNNEGVPANGTYLMEFRLFDALSGGMQIGPIVSDPSVPVVNGIFSVNLDFGAGGFTGAERYLQISVKTNPGDQFTILSPRNRVTSSPYAIKSAGAANADLFGGQPPSAYGTSAQVAALQNQIAQLQAELATATGGTHLWSKGFGATSFDAGYSVAVDGAGNVLVIGRFSGSVNFGGDTLVSAGGSTDTFVAKFSGSTGSHIWSKRFGGNSDDVGRGIAVNGIGDVFVTGYFLGSIDFGGGSLTSAGLDDIFLARLSGEDGSHIWSRRLGGTSADQGRSIAVDAAGDVLVTGHFHGTVDFGGLPLTSLGISDVFAAKYSGDTSLHIWSKRFGGSSFDLGGGVATDAGGNVYLSGDFSGNVNFGGGFLQSSGSYDVFLLKLAAVDGAHIWSKRFGGSAEESGVGVAVDGGGNVFLTGYFRSLMIQFVDGGGLPNRGDFDAYLAKFDPAGVHQWSKTFGGPGADQSLAVALDSGGNPIITGHFNSTANFGGPSLNSAGSDDLFAAKYSSADGSHVWSRRFGGTNSDRGEAIAVDTAGDLFLTGTFASPTLDFGGGPVANAVGLADIFLVKLKK